MYSVNQRSIIFDPLLTRLVSISVPGIKFSVGARWTEPTESNTIKKWEAMLSRYMRSTDSRENGDGLFYRQGPCFMCDGTCVTEVP